MFSKNLTRNSESCGLVRTILTLVVVRFLLYTNVALAQSSSQQILTSLDFKFQEEQDAGTFVGNVANASRLIFVLTQEKLFRLKFEISDPKYFKIGEKNGSLISSRKIDREDVCNMQSTCKLKAEIIVYTDLKDGNYDIFKFIIVTVDISDINDNSPKFPADTVSLSVTESNNLNEELPTSGAIDRDTGQNSVQQYSFKDPTDTFALSVRKNPDGTSYLGIVVKEKLDRETRDFYQLTVIAADGGTPQKFGSVLINISVSDINDNTPEFLHSSYNESVQENVQLKTSILKVEATDKDIGQNADISYQFSSRVSSKIRQKFSIDEQTGEISAQNNIDYEEDKLFQFIVEAVDHGMPQLSSRTNVNLHVIDVNDNSPQININLPPMGTEVSESEPVGKFIAQVLAIDADSGNNGLVVCSMDDDHFSLEKFNDNAPNMYKIVLVKPLDYEQAASIRASITCADNGSPSLSNSTTFVVNILDVNDCRPTFTQSIYYANVMENMDGSEELIEVIAHDWDSGDFGRVTYSIEDKYDGLFSINPTTGMLKVLHALDRENVPKYDFHVIARDNGPERLSSSALVLVTVDDKNDEPPIFSKPVYFGSILENQPAGTLVGTASAEDPDTPTNSKMSYSILQIGTDYTNFSIDSVTGAISSSTIFDREHKDQYQFMIRVVDPTHLPFFSMCNFTVNILDDNDHSPVIHLSVEDNTTLVVQHTTNVGYVITTIYAHDGDEVTSQHSDLTFLIQEGDPNQLFNLNRFTGVLSLARIVTGRDIRVYGLVIMVQDGGIPPRYDTKQLNIRINGTVTPVSESGLSHNILIVIILVGVTSVLALVILITILLIRKIDQQRRKNMASQKNVEEKMYQLKQQEIFTNLSVNMEDDSNSNNLSKRGRKEVSFSLDEEMDAHNTSNGSSQPLTSFQSGLDRVDMFVQNKLSGPSHAKLSNGLMNIPVHTDKQGNHRRSPRDEKNQLTDILKKSSDDIISQSSDETDPSDSGRGGSEDDSSHRGSGIDPEHSSGKFGPQVYHRGGPATTDSKNRHQLYHQYRLSLHPPKSSRQIPLVPSKETHFKQATPSQRSPYSSVTSDFESDYSGDPGSQNRSDSERSVPVSQYFQTSGHSGSSGMAANQVPLFRNPGPNSSMNLTQDWPNRLAPSYNTNTTPTTNNNSSLMRSFHGQPSNRFAIAPPMTSLSSERLTHHNIDRNFTLPSDRSYKHPDRSYTLSSRTNTQSSLTEDDRTTTSGSYSVNPEDIRREIDSMIVRDSVV